MSALLSLVNGQALNEVSVVDRGLMYGQSVFETIAVEDKTPLLLDEHLGRLSLGAARLAIPFDHNHMANDIHKACQSIDQTRFVLRVTLSMGEGGRGYGNPSLAQSVRIVTAHKFPDFPASHIERGVVLGLSSVCLADQPLLAGIKHGNRLEQVLARAAWQDNWHEAVLLNQTGEVVEATQSNVFARRGSSIVTPALDRSGVEGVMRNKIMALSEQSSFSVTVGGLRVPDLQLADEVFVTNSLIGIWPVREFQSNRYSDFSATNEFRELLRKNGAIPFN